MPAIRKILIANRGEIALRISRSAREMGIKTVAVFSEIDRNAPHVRFADEAFYIGPSPSSESYLQVENIIKVAKAAKADAVHPGYGFLSENEKFASKVQQAGLIFIGPSPEAIAVMGSKLAAKEAVAKFEVPLVPGTMKAISEPSEAMQVADKIGYPVLIKASSGGGGKGMRIVHKAEDLKENMERAISEAQSGFADASVFIEKYITVSRHIEFQILGDQHGHIVHLFERECSIQRRHQKVIEEAPSAVLTPAIRENMGKVALLVAQSCNYYGAGTVEFILDEEKNFYFLEMNTRLQVEHPVTEAITGLDLVKLQIQIAQGELLPFTQQDLSINGHAIEVRVYAEDPARNFLPDVGTISTYRRPQGHGVRVDDGFEEGMSVPFYYDPMISKLICHASSRADAIKKMIRAIADYQITGLETTLGFCAFVMQHKAFRKGLFDTLFIEKYFPAKQVQKKEDHEEEKLVTAIAMKLMSEKKPVFADSTADSSSPWKKKF